MCTAQYTGLNISVETMSNYTHLKDTQMLTKLIKSVKNWFNQPAHYSELERFIISRNPQNNAHIEALEREFDSLRSNQNKFVWGRGF